MDFSEGAEHLNTIFAECLVKYIDVLGRKGCSRTALEVCKLLLGLCPAQDPQGVLLRIDFYAIRSRNYEFILDFIERYPEQVHGTNCKLSKTVPSIQLMPNLLMTSGLALSHLPRDEECKNHNGEIEESVKILTEKVESGKLYELFTTEYGVGRAKGVLNPSMKVILCLLLYP